MVIIRSGGVFLMQNILNKYWEKAPRKARGWFRKFFKSERFKQLTQEQRVMSENVIMTFAEGVYQFEGESPQEWDEHGVRCCCLGIFEIKSIINERFIRSVAPILIQFFEFLHEAGHKEDGHMLAEVVREIEPKIVQNWANSRIWWSKNFG